MQLNYLMREIWQQQQSPTGEFTIKIHSEYTEYNLRPIHARPTFKLDSRARQEIPHR